MRRVSKLRPRIIETFRPRVVETRELRPTYQDAQIIEEAPYVYEDQRYLSQRKVELGGNPGFERVILPDSYYSAYSGYEAAPALALQRNNSSYLGSRRYQTATPAYSSATRLAYAPVELTPGIIPRSRKSSVSSAAFRGY